MDTNATLRTIRALCTAIETDGADLTRYVSEYAEALVPLFRDLDEQLREGSPPPSEWAVAFHANDGED